MVETNPKSVFPEEENPHMMEVEEAPVYMNLGQLLLRSFLSMMVIMSFLSPYEQFKTQHFNKWFYDHGTARVQIRILFINTYFTIGALKDNII